MSKLFKNNIFHFALIIIFIVVIITSFLLKGKNDISNNDGQGIAISLGSNHVPTKSEWDEIKAGMSQEYVLSLLGKPGYSIESDEYDLWSYWKSNIENSEEIALFMVPHNDVYTIKFDKKKNVISKEYKYISKEEAKRSLEEAKTS